MIPDDHGCSQESTKVTLMFCGDVMTGRGIDQVLPHPNVPRIHEAYVKSAIDYVKLAERINGVIMRPVNFSYVWGDALSEMSRRSPDVRIVNLETSITTCQSWAPKGINYRMHPRNAPCLTAANIDCCVLANNHVLDFGVLGLLETLETLRENNIKTAGAGQSLDQAMAPAIIETAANCRVVIVSCGSTTSGIPADWAATSDRAGVFLLDDLTVELARKLGDQLSDIKRPGDILVVSIHWGRNWGYFLAAEQRSFAHDLIDQSQVDILYCHSSHHARNIEIYREKLILYGCGDFINDYEGISGYERFRGDLVLMYLAVVDAATGNLVGLDMVPFQIKRFRLHSASKEDACWLRDTLNSHMQSSKLRLDLQADNLLMLQWE